MIKGTLIIVLIFLVVSCKSKFDTHTYENLQFKIEIPSNWHLEVDQNHMAVAVRHYDKASILPPNFNVIVLKKDRNIFETVKKNSQYNCSNGTCHSSIISKKKINNLVRYESLQDITIENKRIIIRQYYFETEDTIFMLSLFNLKTDDNSVNALFNYIISSFVVKV